MPMDLKDLLCQVSVSAKQLLLHKMSLYPQSMAFKVCAQGRFTKRSMTCWPNALFQKRANCKVTCSARLHPSKHYTCYIVELMHKTSSLCDRVKPYKSLAWNSKCEFAVTVMTAMVRCPVKSDQCTKKPSFFGHNKFIFGVLHEWLVRLQPIT